MLNTQELSDYMYDVIGALCEVHSELGPGLNEYCYQEGFQIQLIEQGIHFLKEYSFHPLYHGKEMMTLFRVDFLCKDSIIVECKAVDTLTSNHRAQLFNYMHLMKKPCGILVNFYNKYIEYERYLYDEETKSIVGINGKVFKKLARISVRDERN